MNVFNSALVKEIRRKNSIRLADFAKLLAVSAPYLSMLENGLREPSLTVIERLVNATEIPVEKWLTVNSPSEREEISCFMRNDVTETKSRLNRERRDRQRAEERVWELEQLIEHLMAEIRLHEHFARIVCAESLTMKDKMKKLKKLAILTR